MIIQTSYIAHVEAEFDLPGGKTWNDVKHWYVKWGTLQIEFKDGTEFEVDCGDCDPSEGIDWKRPSNADVYASYDTCEAPIASI